MQPMGILKPVDLPQHAPTAFACQYKQVNKHSKPQLGICVDPFYLFQVIARVPFYYRTQDVIFHKLVQAMMLTIVDFSKGY